MFPLAILMLLIYRFSLLLLLLLLLHVGWAHSGIYLTLLGEITFSESATNPLIEKILLPSSDQQVSRRISSSTLQAHQQHSRNEEQTGRLLKMCTSKKIRLTELTMPLLPGGNLSSGIHEIPFSFALQPMIVGTFGGVVSNQVQDEQKILYETFHGDLISIQYNLYVIINRGYFSRRLECRLEIQVVIPTCSQQNSHCLKALPQSPSMHLTSTDLLVCSRGDWMEDKNAASTHYDSSSTRAVSLLSKQSAPHFDVEVQFASLSLDLNTSLNGKLVVHSCNYPIRSISIYLYRIESLFLHGQHNSNNDESEIPLKRNEKIIQNLQLVYGDVRRKMEIPIFMEYPNLLASPTMSYHHVSLDASTLAASRSLRMVGFQIDHEISIVITFENQWKAEKSIPVVLFRG